MAPPAKRARHVGDVNGGAPSTAECAKMVKRLSTESAHAVLTKLMAISAEAIIAVESELAERDAEPVDEFLYARKTSEIFSLGDGLRESQKPIGKIQGKLTELLQECKQRLSVTQAFQAMVTIVGCVESEAYGEVRKWVIGDGGIDQAIAEELTELVEEMSAEQRSSIGDAVKDLDRTVKVLNEYGAGDELADVVEMVQGNQVASGVPPGACGAVE